MRLVRLAVAFAVTLFALTPRDLSAAPFAYITNYAGVGFLAAAEYRARFLP